MSSAAVSVAAAAVVALTLSGCGGGGTTSAGPSTAPPGTSTAHSTTTLTTTSSQDFSQVCGAANTLANVRGLAAPMNNTAITTLATADACCHACNLDTTCVAWSFQSGGGGTECQNVGTGQDYPWEGVDSNSPEWTFGTKRAVSCVDCAYCGTDSTDIFDTNNDKCFQCANGTNWNQYPCFVPGACKCVTSTTSYHSTLAPVTTTTSSTTASVTTTASSVTSTAASVTTATVAPVTTTTAPATTTVAPLTTTPALSLVV